jgi:hypothetical protein
MRATFPMKILRIVRAPLVAFLFVASVFAAADPSGSWKWSITPPNGDPIEISLTLEMKDGKLAGTYKSPFGESKISNVTWKDDALAFDVEREINGNKFTIKYAGKLTDGVIKGTFEFPGFNGGQPTKQTWDAKRVK